MKWAVVGWLIEWYFKSKNWKKKKTKWVILWFLVTLVLFWKATMKSHAGFEKLHVNVCSCICGKSGSAEWNHMRVCDFARRSECKDGSACLKQNQRQQVHFLAKTTTNHWWWCMMIGSMMILHKAFFHLLSDLNDIRKFVASQRLMMVGDKLLV